MERTIKHDGGLDKIAFYEKPFGRTQEHESVSGRNNKHDGRSSKIGFYKKPHGRRPRTR